MSSLFIEVESVAALNNILSGVSEAQMIGDKDCPYITYGSTTVLQNGNILVEIASEMTHVMEKLEELSIDLLTVIEARAKLGITEVV